MRTRRVAGLLLIFGGAGLLAVFHLGVAAEIAPSLVGAALLGVFAVTRSYGFLVPGGALTGLGIGLLVQSTQGTNGAIPIGIGAGLVFVTLLDHLSAGGRSGRWWPLVPGGIFVAIGLAQYVEGRAPLAPVARSWPALLVITGVLLLWRRLAARRRGVPPGGGAGNP